MAKIVGENYWPIMKRITFSLPWPLSAEHTAEIFQSIFHLSLVGLVATYVMEMARPEFVSAVWSLDIFLWLAIVSGAAVFFLIAAVHPVPVKSRQRAWYQWFVCLVTIGLAAAIVFTRFPGIGVGRVVVTILVAIIVMTMVFSFTAEDQS